MDKIRSFFYGFRSFSELERCHEQIQKRRFARRNRMSSKSVCLTDSENLERDMVMIGRDFQTAIGAVMNAKS